MNVPNELERSAVVAPGAARGHRRASGAILPLATAIVLAAMVVARASAAEEEGKEDDSSSEANLTYVPGRALPDFETLEALGAEIGEIIIVRKDVFDTDQPEEDRWYFRAVNRLHPKTRERLIRKQLLFAEGEPFTVRSVADSERLLRKNRYIYDAEITPVRFEDGRVDLQLVTQDVWTLSGGVSFNRGGGENAAKVQVRDGNFLGTGRELTASYSTDVDRRSTRLRFVDGNFFASHQRLELEYADNSDGQKSVVGLQRPFVNVETPWSAGVWTVSDDRVERLYSQGEVSDEFGLERRFFQTHWGRSLSRRDGRATRLTFGLTYDDRRFLELAEGVVTDELRGRRTLAFPWVGVEWVQEQFVEMHDLNHLSRTEDVDLGWSLAARLGQSSPSFGASQSSSIFELQARVGTNLSPRSMFLSEGHVYGRLADTGVENGLVGGAASLHWQNLGRHRFLVQLSGDVGQNLDPENQLLLGGDNGLRGYPLRYRDGDRRLLLTLEQRFYTDWHLFQLVRVGGAVFFDAGAAWLRGSEAGPEWLRDVGFGLRLSPSRSSRASMIHVDVAFPLDGDASIRSVQWLVSSKETF